MNSDRETELIKLLYTLAVEPQQLHIFLSVIDGLLEEMYSEDKKQPPTVLLERLDEHIAAANTLLDRHGSTHSDQAIVEHAIDIDRMPAFMLGPDMAVRYVNTAAEDGLGVKTGLRLSRSIMSMAEYQRLEKMMKAVNAKAAGRFLGVFQLLSEDGSNADRMVLSKSTDKDGQPVGHLASLRTRWQPHTGEAFREAFQLSQAEGEIVQAIVDGESLDDVADRRGTAIGTVRNQTKRLLSKLNIHSQTELVCLFAGFSQVSPLPVGLGTSHFPDHGLGGIGKFFTRSDGTQLEYEVFGSPTGRPVLFLHPMIGGTGLTKRQKNLIAEHDLKLIMPWLPLFKGTEDSGELETIGSRYAQDINGLLESLEITSCGMLCVNTSLIYGLEIAGRFPEKISKIVAGNGAVPLLSPGQFSQISMQQRIPYYIARHMPWLLDFYIKSVRAKLESGYEVEYVRRYYEDSPVDIETILEPEIRMIASQSIAYAFEQGHHPVVTHIKLEASDWMHLLKNCPVPVELLTGEFDVEYPPEMIAGATRDMPHVTPVIVEDAGILVWFQKPEALLSRL